MSFKTINLEDLKSQMQSMIKVASKVIELCELENPCYPEISLLASEGVDEIQKQTYRTLAPNYFAIKDASYLRRHEPAMPKMPLSQYGHSTTSWGCLGAARFHSPKSHNNAFEGSSIPYRQEVDLKV